MSDDYSGLQVVVTGGTGALGSAVVRRLVEAGATCHVPYRAEEDLERFEFMGHPRVSLAAGVDLTDEGAVVDFYGRLDSLWASVHAAGGFAFGPIEQHSLADFRDMMDTNAVTCFLCCREAAKKMRGSGQGGRIVNVAAKTALVPTKGMVAYAASKSAVVSITLSLAEELASDRIWVNAVVPSIVDTPANRKAMPKADRGRWPKVDEVAATIVFLASPENRVTRGALVPVYGESG